MIGWITLGISVGTLGICGLQLHWTRQAREEAKDAD